MAKADGSGVAGKPPGGAAGSKPPGISLMPTKRGALPTVTVPGGLLTWLVRPERSGIERICRPHAEVIVNQGVAAANRKFSLLAKDFADPSGARIGRPHHGNARSKIFVVPIPEAGTVVQRASGGERNFACVDGRAACGAFLRAPVEPTGEAQGRATGALQSAGSYLGPAGFIWRRQQGPAQAVSQRHAGRNFPRVLTVHFVLFHGVTALDGRPERQWIAGAVVIVDGIALGNDAHNGERGVVIEAVEAAVHGRKTRGRRIEGRAGVGNGGIRAEPAGIHAGRRK